jgi:hypothetical protein
MVTSHGHFAWSWTCDGEPSGNNVRTETDTVVLMYRSRNWGDAEWKSVRQRAKITWTACSFGSRRPRFK